MNKTSFDNKDKKLTVSKLALINLLYNANDEISVHLICSFLENRASKKIKITIEE